MSKDPVFESLDTLQEHSSLWRKIRTLVHIEHCGEDLGMYMDRFWVNTNFGKIELQGSVRLHRLFSLFIGGKKHAYTRGELIELIYGRQQNSPISLRQQSCLNHNLVKLISRGRALAKTHLVNCPVEIRWFPYDSQNATWELFRVMLPTEDHL